MRPLLLILLTLAIAAVATFAWVRAGHDRYGALEDEGMALARVLRGAAAEAALAVGTAESNLAARLAAVARHADGVVAGTRAPAAELLAGVAEENDVGQIFLFDASGRSIAYAQWPPPVEPARDAILPPKRKEELRWREAQVALAARTPKAREVLVEGLKSNVFGTRERFGVLYGREAGGTLLLRANAQELSSLRERFGLDPLLDHYVEVPSVEAVRVWGADGTIRLARGLEAASATAPTGLSVDGRVARDGPHLRALLPVQTAVEDLVVEVRLARAGADAAVDASRRTILLGALLALVLALGAGIVLLVRDTALRRAAAAAAAKLEEERRLAEMGALAGLVTHEVNNPLNSIRLALGVLEGAAQGANADVVATMKQEVVRMARTLDGYMALAGSDRRPPRAVPASLLESVRERVAAEARERGIHVALHVADDAPAIAGDPVVLEQALSNLVRNALQACAPQGTVSLAWRRGPAGDVEIHVDDEGAGWPDDREALLRLGGTRREDGHGLGLPLAKRFIETHHGRIVLEDRPGGGARVTVRLPAHGGDDA